MSVATLPSDPPVSGTRGAAEVSFRLVDGESRLDRLFHTDPLKVLFPTPPAGEPPLGAIVTTAGGLVGGDELSLDVGVEAGASALMVAQAAEKVYRSAGPDCHVAVRLTAAQGGWLEWLPQETILFEGARLRRVTIVDREPGGRVLAGEMIMFGRLARGEKLTHGLVRDAWEVRTAGRLVWADALHFGGAISDVLADPACFDGAVACATAVYAADDAAERVFLARECLDAGGDGVRSGASLVNGVLVVRWLGRDPKALRDGFGRFWAGFRHGVAGLPRKLPRLWSV
jgi:urease accessory protein